MTEWKPTLYIPLTVQEAPRSQAALFASPEARVESPCDHAGDRQRQERFDGGTDELCCACGGETQAARGTDMAENTDSRTSSDPPAAPGREDEDNLVSFPRAAKSAKLPPRRRANAERRSREYLTRDEVLSVASAKRGGRNGHRDRLVILTLYRHGLRVAELARLTWDDVTFGRSCTMNVRRVKNGVTSTHPLNGDEVRELKQLQREQDPPSRFVFCSERGGPMSPRTVHRIVADAGEAAGIPFPVHPHMLRHAKGFQLANRGIDTRAIQAWLGHRRIESTTVYTALDAGRFKDFNED